MSKEKLEIGATIAGVVIFIIIIIGNFKPKSSAGKSVDTSAGARGPTAVGARA